MKRREVASLAAELGLHASWWGLQGDGLLADYDDRDRLVRLAWMVDGVAVGARLELWCITTNDDSGEDGDDLRRVRAQSPAAMAVERESRDPG